MATMKQINIQLSGVQPVTSGHRHRHAALDVDDVDRTPLSVARDPLIRDLADPQPQCPVEGEKPGSKTNVYYFKYLPFETMSGTEKKKFLGTIPSIDDGEAKGKAVTKWATAQRSGHQLPYHLAEMSMHYRAPPELSQSRLKKVQANGCPRPTEELLSGTTTPATTRCSSPHKTDKPEELLAKSTSNRLLNVVSIDECHVKHRRARKMVSQSQPGSHLASRVASRLEQHNPLKNDRDVPSVTGDYLMDRIAGMNAANSEPKLRTERTLTAATMTPRERTEHAMQRAHQRHEKRNQLLRDQMEIYMQWRQAEKTKDRESLASGGRSSAQGIRKISKYDRLKTFSTILQENEKQFAQQMEEQASNDNFYKDDDFEDNKLTKMWEVLQ